VRAAAGEPVLGICGGLQLLGERIEDPHGVDGASNGLGHLPLITTFARDKLTRRTATRFGKLARPWHTLAGLSFSGYEIRHGRTRVTGNVSPALPDGLGFARGPVLGIYLHGLLEDSAAVAALLGDAPARTLEATFDELADAVEGHLDLTAVEALLGAPV